MSKNSLALGTALALLTSHVAAETENYGCGVNPAGSLIVLSGDALLGSTMLLGLDNPLGTQSVGSVGFVLVSALPDAAFPCGTLATGISMSSFAQPGELLIDLFTPSLLLVLATSPYGGDGQPALAQLSIPNATHLEGLEIFAQGFLVDTTGLGSVVVGASEGLRLRFEAPGSEAAPTLSVVDFDRHAYAESRGFDYDYDGGVSDIATSFGAVTTWSGVAAVEHEDFYGTPIGESAAHHRSRVGQRTITAQLLTEARTHGNLFQEDALAQCDLDVHFDLAQRVRFTASATGTVSGGYGEVRVALGASRGPVLALNVYQGQSTSADTSGWLQVGSLSVECVAMASAYGSSANGGFDEQHTSELDFEFTIFHQCDIDLDGDVDINDFHAFHQLLSDGSLDADINGNGVADGFDGALFDAAWNAVQ